MDSFNSQKYHLGLAAAFVLGKIPELQHETLVRMGEVGGLKMDRFKKVPLLPRVSKAIEMLKSLAPSDILDIGSGQGTGLIQILLEFPNILIGAVENDPFRIQNLQALELGFDTLRCNGMHQPAHLVVHAESALDLSAEDGSWDVVTALEVLEHIEDTQRAVTELVRVSGRCVVFSVPSEPDNNPRHVHLHTPEDITRMFCMAGATKITFDSVPEHTVGVAWKR